MHEHAVIAHFEYEQDNLEPLHDVEDRLDAAIDDAGVGELDGNEIAVDLSDGALFMYGPDAEAIFNVVRPILAEASCLKNLRVTLRFGPPEDGVAERIEVFEN